MFSGVRLSRASGKGIRQKKGGGELGQGGWQGPVEAVADGKGAARIAKGIRPALTAVPPRSMPRTKATFYLRCEWEYRV